MRIFAFALIAAAAACIAGGKFCVQDMGVIRSNFKCFVYNFAAEEYEEFNILRFVEVRSKQGRAKEFKCDWFFLISSN